MKFGEVFDYRTAEEAKQYIGKNGAFSDSLRAITESPSECFGGTFMKIEMEEECPFYGGNDYGFQFFRPILEEELMTNRQFAEWLAKGKGECTLEKSLRTYSHYDYPRTNEHGSVPDSILIRHWGDTEWSKPTKAIYEEDCLTKLIESEDCR